jgi:hypothetical protein
MRLGYKHEAGWRIGDCGTISIPSFSVVTVILLADYADSRVMTYTRPMVEGLAWEAVPGALVNI